MTYKYRKLAPGQHLYDDCNLNDGGLIDAQYEESVVDSYHGNPKAHPTVPHQHHITWSNGKPRRGKDEEVK